MQSTIIIRVMFALQVVPIVALSIGHSLFSRQGINSLVLEGSKIFAGTKRGDLLILEHPNGPIEVTTQITKADTKTFPVYSLASSPEFVFCGCGDRYISVLDNTEGERRYSQGLRLGPHTGWVKDLYLDSRSGILFSIGCNCIEAWGLTAEGTWEHMKKRSIESSPTEGSTLSSDLLCLCSGDPSNDFFYAGGVDGRIHVWSTDIIIDQPLLSVGAHTGRLNCLMYDCDSDLLFSAGHDGMLQCRRAGLQLDEPIATFELGEDARVTAGALIKSSDSSLELILGCSNGVLALLRVAFDKDGVSISERHRMSLSDDCSVRSLLMIPTEIGPPAVLVGHSKGLDLVNLS